MEKKENILDLLGRIGLNEVHIEMQVAFVLCSKTNCQSLEAAFARPFACVWGHLTTLLTESPWLGLTERNYNHRLFM